MAKGLPPAAIQAIIETCSKNNVASFKMDGLEIDFFKVSLSPAIPWPEQTEEDPEHVAAVPEEKREAVPIVFSEEEKQILEDARLGQLMMDDPVAYEQEIIDSTIEDQTDGEA